MKVEATSGKVGGGEASGRPAAHANGTAKSEQAFTTPWLDVFTSFQFAKAPHNSVRTLQRATGHIQYTKVLYSLPQHT